MKPIEKNQEFHQNIALAAIDKDAALLNFHEDGLRDNAESMFAFAVHLYQIKSKELWRHAECSSFKNYCENRVPTLFKMVLGKSQLYRLAEWAGVDGDVSPIGENPNETSTPSVSESQARELAKAPKAKRAKIVKDVAKKGKVTAKAIAAEVKKQAAVEAEFEMLDKTGHPIPKRIRMAWEHAEAEAEAILKFLMPAKKLMEEKIQNDPAWIELSNNENTKIKALVGEARRIIPHAVCPSCDANGRGCKHCKQNGYISKYLWDACSQEAKGSRK